MSLPQYHHHHSTRFRPQKSYLSTPQKRLLGYFAALFIIAMFILATIKLNSNEPSEFELKKLENVQSENVNSKNAEKERQKQQLLDEAIEMEFEKARTEKELEAEIEAIDAEIARKMENGQPELNEDEEPKDGPEPKRGNIKTASNEKQLD
jgi:hypothetical protein